MEFAELTIYHKEAFLDALVENLSLMLKVEARVQVEAKIADWISGDGQWKILRHEG